MMTYSISMAIILTSMLAMGIVFLFVSNKYTKKIMQAVAVVMAIAAYYCHYQAEAKGEYHAISLVVAEHIVTVVQYYAGTSIGRILVRFINYAQNNEWVIYLISIVVLALIYFMPSIIKDIKRRRRQNKHLTSSSTEYNT